ncbi:SRPBCC family protein [Bryobacter aggregatus]|uniref:SRPBCC family protein n=1 Tax=Bryobacter aggregatus TaxID=360054 RepID=UPI0004E1A443|nr:SRPBCC family protein [Bryobacter aggregatus]
MTNPANLTVSTSGERNIVMTRLFHAPRHLVFDAMTQPELMLRWFSGPPGWTMVVCDMDLRVGGAYRYVWRSPKGIEMGMGGVIRELIIPERMVQTEKFDESWYEGEAVGTLELSEVGEKTLLTLTMEYDSQQTRDAILKTPMDQGVAECYNNLAALLTALYGSKGSKDND